MAYKIDQYLAVEEFVTRFTEADVRRLVKVPQVAKPNKYRAKATVIDGVRFSSKLEANYYLELKALQKAGEIGWFITQPPFRLPSGIVYRADFLIVWKDGRISVSDIKGFMTPVSRLKIAQVEAIYGIKVEIITRSTKK